MTTQERVEKLIEQGPGKLPGAEYRYDSFKTGEVLLGKKKNHLPAMGWNSWNAFGSGNTEALTKKMAEKLVELGLDQLGYRYVVLDDGCYKPERIDGKISNEEVKFPSGFRALADTLHGMGLKFGMYNDIGTNLCAGAAVGTCGQEQIDGKSYIDWDIDFLKVDNCYYLWDNATFSDAANAKYVYAPRIRSILVRGNGFETGYSAVKDGVLVGQGAKKCGEYVDNIGTFDGTGPAESPVGERSGELCFSVNVPESGEYDLIVEYASGEEPGCGSWLQAAAGEQGELFFDDFLPKTDGPDHFAWSPVIRIRLEKGDNSVRLMNHRRQENTLKSYAAMLNGLNEAKTDHDVILSICEWGKTQPQNWGYKVGDSWRILNDITFRVGSDGDPGFGAWENDYTTGVTSQYNKAVIMDEFAGLDKGWNDPDMLMIGMNGLDEVMCRSHMTMWCMMNSPLMLGMDLRRVEKGDWMYRIISNRELIALNQDALGIQAKRIYTSNQSGSALSEEEAGKPVDQAYLRGNDRVDVLAKPLSDGSIALSFLNLSGEKKTEGYRVDADLIDRLIGRKMVNRQDFAKAKSYRIRNLWTGEETVADSGSFGVDALDAHDQVTYRITPV